MSFKNFIPLIALIFLISSSLYGYITGSTFYIKHMLFSDSLFKLIYVSVTFISLCPVILLQAINPKQFILPVMINVLFIIILSSQIDLDLGSVFRFYISPFCFWFLFVLSLLSLVLKKKNVKYQDDLSTILPIVTSFSAGLIIYFFKSNYIVIGNTNFAIQFILSIFFLALPAYFSLLFAIFKIKKKKLNGVRAD